MNSDFQTVINAAIIEDGRLLVFQKNEKWILPGGKKGIYESDETCLRRECHEESSGMELSYKSPSFYRTFEGISPTTNKPTIVRVYFIGRSERKEIIPSGEINRVAQATYNELQRYECSDITRGIVERLHSEGYL